MFCGSRRIHAAVTAHLQEILYRELMGYPPVDEMLGIYLSGKDLEKLESCAEQLAEWIRNAHVEGLCLIGPADAALARKNDSYRKVIYMKHEKKIILLKIKKLLEQQIAGTERGCRRFSFDR